MRSSLALKTLFFVIALPFVCFAQAQEGRKDCQNDSGLLLKKKGTPAFVGAKDLRSRIIRHQTPEYPKACRCAGSVQVLARINTEGRIDCFRFLSGHPLLRASISQVLKEWEFQPVITKGKTISVLTVITFSFDSAYGFSDDISAPQELPCSSEEKVLKDEKGRLVWFGSRELEEMAIHKPEPIRDAHLKIGGTLFTDILVNDKGEVICAKAANGHPILRNHAVAAAKQWRFKPMVVNGRPIAFAGRLRFFVSSY